VEVIISLCLGVVGQLNVCIVHVALVSVATTAADAFTLDEAPFSKVTGQTLARDGVVGGNEFDVGFPIVVEYGKVHAISLVANTVDLQAVLGGDGLQGGGRRTNGAGSQEGG
jgi:hypothetical protein